MPKSRIITPVVIEPPQKIQKISIFKIVVLKPPPFSSKYRKFCKGGPLHFFNIKFFLQGGTLAFLKEDFYTRYLPCKISKNFLSEYNPPLKKMANFSDLGGFYSDFYGILFELNENKFILKI